MKMTLIALLFFLMTTACERKQKLDPMPVEKLKKGTLTELYSQYPHGYLARYEDDEVKCFIISGQALQCFLKK